MTTVVLVVGLLGLFGAIWLAADAVHQFRRRRRRPLPPRVSPTLLSQYRDEVIFNAVKGKRRVRTDFNRSFR